MTGGYSEPVILDATVLSNFASTDGVSLLTTVLESPVVVPAVRDELERGLEAGHEYLDTVVDALEDDLPVQSLGSDRGRQEIRDRLDLGEAESLLAAIEHGGTLATDDLAARKVADRRDVPVTGSIGLLVLGVESGYLDRGTADEWLDTWREQRGYYAPVESVTEILDDT
ncbi:MAG: twitching motility protein PilT [Halapricum sp.]